MNKIFDIESLEELRTYLTSKPDTETLREQLYAEFMKLSQYRNAEEWNSVVRICEALAIIGWGKHEAVVAIKTPWFNGDPNTFFVNRHGQSVYNNAVWVRRKGGLAIDYMVDRKIGEVQDIRLTKQRNWVATNPIRVSVWIANCYTNTKPLIESIDNQLMPMLYERMRPELYGSAVKFFGIGLSFSYYDHSHCKQNYIIADENLKLKKKDYDAKLLEMYSEKEIENNGYCLRNRFTYGPFRKDTGIMYIDLVFEKEFSMMSTQEQRKKLCEYLYHAVEQATKRLEKKLSYNFPLMLSDLKNVLESWEHNNNT